MCFPKPPKMQAPQQIAAPAPPELEPLPPIPTPIPSMTPQYAISRPSSPLLGPARSQGSDPRTENKGRQSLVIDLGGMMEPGGTVGLQIPT